MTEIKGQKSKISKATALGAMVFALYSLLLAPCSAVQAQQPGKVARIGFLDRSTSSALQVSPFLQELSKLGWVEVKEYHLRVQIRRGEN
jgi:hypothetical protein